MLNDVGKAEWILASPGGAADPPAFAEKKMPDVDLGIVIRHS
jgi:hypothetical protein